MNILDDKPVINPYVEARREWNERYGSYIKSRDQWRNMAFMSMAFALICLVGFIYHSSQSKFIPYVVEVDQLGRSVAVSPASQTNAHDERVIKSQLSRFIVNTRSVTSDAEVQKSWIFEAYTMINPADPSFLFLQNHFQTTANPFVRAARVTVEIKVSTVLRQTNESWEIEWIETTKNRKGELIGDPVRMRSLMQIYLTVPEKIEQIYKNPAGVYIKDLSWSNAL